MTISGGTLALGNPDALGNGGSLTVAADAALAESRAKAYATPLKDFHVGDPDLGHERERAAITICPVGGPAVPPTAVDLATIARAISPL